jgi:hypothetical protein
VDSYYTILGVPPSASYDQMLASYRERSALLDPPGAGRTKAPISDNMRAAQIRLDEAWNVLSQVSSRRRYDREVLGITGATYQEPPLPGTEEEPEQTGHRPRRRDECRLCGSSPAVAVDIRSSRSGALSGLFTGGNGERGPLCRDCGLATFRDMTDTVLTGGIDPSVGNGYGVGDVLALLWLFIIGWLINGVTALGNLWAWHAVHSLAAPTRDPDVKSTLKAPMDPGRSLLRRSGFRLTVIIAVVWAVLLFVLVSLF